MGRVDDQMLVYSLRNATIDGRTELNLTPLELLDRLAKLITPPQMELELSQANPTADGWAINDDQAVGGPDEWPDMDQTASEGNDTWE